MTQYIEVVEIEGEEPIELPSESDGTLLLSSLEAQFPGATGLRYRPAPDARSFRGLRLADGVIHPPAEGWENFTFVCTLPKENKRKPDDNLENLSTKTQRREGNNLCSDLIVLGLPWTTTDEQLNSCFSQYGELVMSQVKKDPKTGKSKGFGFIKFAEYSVQQRVVGRRHIVEGRTCDVKLPNSKGDAATQQFNSKVFIGRLTEYITNEDLIDHFSKFGEITDVYIPKPFRGFAFVTFIDPEVAQGLCGEDHIVKGTSLHVGNAIPKNQQGGAGGARGNQGNQGNQSNFQGDNSWNQGGNNSGPDMNSFNMQALAMPMLQALNSAGFGGMLANMQQQQQPGGNQGNYGGGNQGNYGGSNNGNAGYGNQSQETTSYGSSANNSNNGSYGNTSNRGGYGGNTSYGGGASNYGSSSNYGGGNNTRHGTGGSSSSNTWKS